MSVVSFTITSTEQSPEHEGLLPFEHLYKVKMNVQPGINVFARIEEFEEHFIGEGITYYFNLNEETYKGGDGYYTIGIYRDEDCSIKAGSLTLERDWSDEGDEDKNYDQINVTDLIEYGVEELDGNHITFNLNQSYDLNIDPEVPDEAIVIDTEVNENNSEEEEDEDEYEIELAEYDCRCADYQGETYLLHFEEGEEASSKAKVFDFDTQDLIGEVLNPDTDEAEWIFYNQQ